jgi:hypothetical protein
VQPRTSLLNDPEAVATNARGDLTPAQRAALRRFLPGVVGDWFLLAFATMILGVVLYNWRIASRIFRAKDPLPSTEHFFGHTVTLPGFHLLAALIVGAWALVFFSRIVLLVDHARDSNELKPGHVATAEGTIAWDRHAYVALLPGRRRPLQPWDYTAIDGCPPGPCRLWYLRRGGWLLSLQSLVAADAHVGQMGEDAALIGALANANGFLPAALDTNRAGRLGEQQARGLARGERARAFWRLVISIGFIAVVPAFWYYGNLKSALLCAVAGLLLYVQSLREPSRSALDKDIADGRVLAVEGKARKAHRRTYSLLGSIAGGSGTTDFYSYDIAGQRFPVSETAYHALVDDVPYRFYYLPRSRTIINIEPLG